MGLFMTQFAESNKPFGGYRDCQSNVTPEVPKWESQNPIAMADFLGMTL